MVIVTRPEPVVSKALKSIASAEVIFTTPLPVAPASTFKVADKTPNAAEAAASSAITSPSNVKAELVAVTTAAPYTLPALVPAPFAVSVILPA